jgi:hypothetical protein
MNLDNQKNQFFITTKPTPTFNRPDLKNIFGGENGHTLLLDERGHMRALEFIALKNSIFEYVENAATHPTHLIYKVKMDDYPNKNLFIDSRFVRKATKFELLPRPQKPEFNSYYVLKKIEGLLGLPYLWGGNWSSGIDEMLRLYPPSKELDPITKSKWTLNGVDCSGLLYEALDGFCPRNTKELIKFGSFLNIEGLSIKKIISLLQPLDLIVYIGHLIIVKDKNFTIESRETQGVVQTPIEKRFEELLQNKKSSSSLPSDNNCFVIKRWITN